jgi:HrpA-like RNA helicase
MPTLLNKGALIQPELPDEIPINYIDATVKKHLQQVPNMANPFLNRLMILEAKTASGKSKTVPPHMFIMTQELEDYQHKSVLCTQPRILTAQANAEELHNKAWFGDTVFMLGQNLGFSTSVVAQRVARNGLMFATLGTLEAQLQMGDDDFIIKKYSVIIIDEAHERALIFDSTMCLLKMFYKRNAKNPKLPYLILMSATFDVQKYRAYFDAEETNIVRVAGFSFPIEDRWSKDDVQDVLKQACTTVVECAHIELDKAIANKLHHNAKQVRCDNRILVFVPGIGENKQLTKHLEATKLLNGKIIEKGKLKVLLRIDQSYIDGDAVKKVTTDYIKIMGSKEKPHDFEFIIDSIHVNAVAETGLTLENLLYVIDCGWSREAEFNPTYNINSMVLTKPAAQSRIMQRRGRVGRTKPGIFIPLYTKETFDALQEIQNPEIIQSDPTNLILNSIVINDGFDNSNLKLMMDTPPQESIIYAMEKLQMLGLINEDFKPTSVGKIVVKICNTISIEAATMIMAGFTYDAYIDDLIVIAVMMKYATGPKSYIGNSDEFVRKHKIRSPFSIPRKAYQYMFKSYFNIQEDIPNLYYKIAALLSDDFIINLIIFRAFQQYYNYISADDKKLDNISMLKTIQAWCDNCTLKFDVMLDIYNDYVNVKSTLILAGIDVEHGNEYDFTANFAQNPDLIEFLNELKPMSTELIDPVIKLKLCIMHGFKFNTAIYDEAKNQYRINWGQYPVDMINYFANNAEADIVWNKFNIEKDYFPKRVMFYSSTIMYKKQIGLYQLSLNGLSIASGFV